MADPLAGTKPLKNYTENSDCEATHFVIQILFKWAS